MTSLFGHDAAVAAFRAGLEGGCLHHAWLITGPKGIGKATFARAAALRALAEDPPDPFPNLEVDPEGRSAKLFAAGAHPDFHLVEREVWDKKGEIVPKHERSGSEELGRSLRIKQVRMVNAALSQTTSISKRRVVVINSADDLEPAAANALLKNLEEPPASTTFLLVSHAPSRLLPTIRSRCRALRLAPLAPDVMASALRAAMPDADDKEIRMLVEAGEGAPGRASALRGLDITGLEESMRQLVREGDPTNARRSALAQSLALKAAQPRYEAFLARAPSLIAAEAKERRGTASSNAIDLWERASALAGAARRHSLDTPSVVFELAGLLAALGPQAPKSAA